MRLFRYIVAALGFVSLIAIALFLKLCFDIDRQGRMDQAQPADAIVVLGAQVLLNGQAGPDLEPRTAHAVSLYQAGLAPRIICTGGLTLGSCQLWPFAWLAVSAGLSSPGAVSVPVRATV